MATELILLMKEQFWSNIDKSRISRWIRIYPEDDDFENKLYGESTIRSKSECIYFTYQGYYLVWVTTYQCFICPDYMYDQMIQDALVKNPVRIALDLTWKITKVSDQPDPKYIRNHYLRTPSLSISEEGMWRLENLINERMTIEFSVKKFEHWSESQYYTCYKEKTMYDTNVNYIESLITLIFNERGRTEETGNS